MKRYAFSWGVTFLGLRYFQVCVSLQQLESPTAAAGALGLQPLQAATVITMFV